MNNLITEPNFYALGTDASKWAIITHKGVEMKPTLQDSALQLDISKTTGANWHGELRYAPFPVLVGEIYTVSFSVKAERPFTFSVWLGQQDSPHKSLVSDENHFGEKMMTSEWQTFTHTWKPILSEKAARLNFVFGQIDNVVEIRDVELNMNIIERLSPHLPTSDVKKMVDFYESLGFSLVGEIGLKNDVPVFARLELGSQQIRIELWSLSNWEELRKGFSVTTLWIETDSVNSVAERLTKNGVSFEGPSVEDYGSTEIELFDPEGFRIIYSET